MAAAPILGTMPPQRALHAVTPQPGETYGDGEPSEYAGPLDLRRDLARVALADIGYVHDGTAPALTRSPKLYRELGIHAIGNTPQVVRDRVNEAADSGAEEPAQKLREARDELTRLRAQADALSDNNSRATLDQLDLDSRIRASEAEIKRHEDELQQIERRRQEIVAGTMIQETLRSSTRVERFRWEVQNMCTALNERMVDLGAGLRKHTDTFRLPAGVKRVWWQAQDTSTALVEWLGGSLRNFGSTVGAFWEKARREARPAVGDAVSLTIAYGVLGFVDGLRAIGWVKDRATSILHEKTSSSVTESEKIEQQPDQPPPRVRPGTPRQWFARPDLAPPGKRVGFQPPREETPTPATAAPQIAAMQPDAEPSPREAGIEALLIQALASKIQELPEGTPAAQRAEALAHAEAIRQSLAATEEFGSVVAQARRTTAIDTAIAAALIAKGLVTEQRASDNQAGQYTSTLDHSTLYAIANTLKAYYMTYIHDGPPNRQQPA